jgi:ubiquinone/menaquinone biosynthesis C-methylase UbiE
MLWRGNNPAAAVYDSLGSDFFLALDDGWLNLGLWEGDGSDRTEAPAAVRRLVATLAADLQVGRTILDVGNGLGEQDRLIAEVANPHTLIALNITESQLRSGRAVLSSAGAIPVNGDATRIPLRDASIDGVICVEAAFHFASRAAFFAEAFRVLRPGGVLTMSDVPTQRTPRGAAELVAGVSQLRLWGLRTGAAEPAASIARRVEETGFRDVRSQLVGERVIGPALVFVRRKLDREEEAPASFRLAARVMLAQVELLWRRRVIDYLLLRAVKPQGD